MSKHKNRNQNQAAPATEDLPEHESEEGDDLPIVEDYTVQTDDSPPPEGELSVSATEDAPIEMAPAPISPYPVEPIEEPTVTVASTMSEQTTNPTTAAKPVSVTTTRKRTAADKVTTLCNEYYTLASKGLQTPMAQKLAATKLLEVCTTVAVSHDKSVYNAFLNFFMLHQQLMLSPQLVLTGVADNVEHDKIQKLVDLYLIFTEMTRCRKAKQSGEKYRFPLNIEHIEHLFNRQLAEWVVDNH